MKILFVLENYYPHIGGVEIIFKNLCERLAKKGHEVIVLTHRLPNTKKEEIINDVKIVRVRCMDSRYLFTFASIPKAISLAKWADVIHTTTFNAAPPAWLAAKIRKKKIVITVHETWIGKWREYTNFSPLKATVHEMLERAVFFPTYDIYSCVSNATAKRLREVKPKLSKRVITIHNGFDPSLWIAPRKKEAASLQKELHLDKAGKAFVIFAYGRPGTSKGMQYLLEAYPHIKKKIPHAKLLLMLSSDKQYSHVLEKMKQEADEGVIFVASKPYAQIPTYTHMADCVVVPSITEGFGYNVIEACNAGTPIVASNTTSIPEVIFGKHILVAPKNPIAIADGVYGVYKKQYKITPAKSFTWASNITAHEKLYKSLMKK